MLQRFLNVIGMLLAGVVATSAAVVKGVVADSSGEPLPQATIRLLKQNSDSTFVTGTATDIDGNFTLPDVKAGRYILQASYIGYESECKQIKVGSQALDVDTLRLRESSIVLKEATAIGVATPIKVMEDTIEYNASSYTTPPNAMVGDLLKRLPGVEVGSDGSITAQGQTVKKILVDGEEFFSDDPAVASKNIPVAMVKNAQVINRKSDLARMTGVDDGEDETVINLTVKPEMKNGWFGQAEAGYGVPDNRYKGNFTLNRYFNSNTFTLLGNANNVNDAGFTDNNGQRFSRFGGNNGINTTQSLGFNFNVGNKVFRAGGSVMYSHNDRHNHSESYRQNIFADYTTIDETEKDSRDKGHNVRGDFRLKWDPDSFNTLEFRPNFSLNYNDSQSFSTSFNSQDVGTAITNSRNISTNNGNSLELGGRLIYNHNFRSHKGRSFSISANYNLSNVYQDGISWSRNAYWLVDPDSLYEDYQLIQNHTWSNGVNSRLSWTEPIGNVKNGNFLEFSYMMDYKWNNADKTVRHAPDSEAPIPDALREAWRVEGNRAETWAIWNGWGLPVQPENLTWDTDNSNSFRNNYFNQSVRVGYKKVSAKYTLNAGLSFNPQMSRSTNLTNPDKTIPTRWVMNYSPFARLRYKFSSQTSLNAFYNGRSSQPSMTQLQPVADTSDPMNIIQGNPDLNPSFSHNLRFFFRTFDQDKQQSITFMGHGNYTQNAIASIVETNMATGGRTTRYTNVNGNFNAGFFTIYSRPLGHSKLFTLNNNMSFMYSENVGYIQQNKAQAAAKNTSHGTNFSESLGIAYRPTDLELELRPNYRLQHTTNSIATYKGSTVHSYGGTFNGTWYTKFGLVLSTDLTYSASRGYASGYDEDQWMWNASLSYMFLRGKNATFAIKGYDLLNQRKSISRSESAQAIIDSRNLVLGRYVMATFTYKFTTFAGGNVPADDNADFMRQGPPGSGMRGGAPGGPGGPGPR